MIEFKKNIDGVKTFKVFDNTILYINNESELFKENIFIAKQVLDTGYTILNQKIIYLSNSNTYIGNELIENLSYVIGSEDSKTKTILLSGDFKLNYPSFSNCYYLYNIDNNSKNILLEFSNLYNFFRDNYLIFFSDKIKIHAYTLPTATLLWQFDLGIFGEYKPIYSSENERKPYQVAKFLGVWQNQLLVACDGGLILCLSTESGVVLRKWDTLPNSAEESLKNVFRGFIHQSGNVFQLNKAGNKIIGLYYCHWVEICLETGNISTKHLRDTFDTHSISSFQKKSGYAEDETHLYSTVFLDQEKLGLNYMPTAICALNKETTQIDWFYRFDLDNTDDYVSVQVPQVSNGKLYQLTQNNVLHIFEKEL